MLALIVFDVLTEVLMTLQVFWELLCVDFSLVTSAFFFRVM